MIAKIIGDDAAGQISKAAMTASIAGSIGEKQADAGMEKDAQLSFLQLLGHISSGISRTWSAGKNLLTAAKGVPKTVAALAAAGIGTGAVAGAAYNSMMRRATGRDPQEKLDTKIEAEYSGRSREIQDAIWMARVRAKRNRLIREGKKMPPEQYAEEYNSLMSELGKKMEA